MPNSPSISEVPFPWFPLGEAYRPQPGWCHPWKDSAATRPTSSRPQHGQKRGQKRLDRNSRDKERDIMGIIWDYYEDMTSMTSNMEISWIILEVIWGYWWCFLGTVLCIGVIDPRDIDQCGGFRFVDDWGYPSPGETKPTNRTRRAMGDTLTHLAKTLENRLEMINQGPLVASGLCQYQRELWQAEHQRQQKCKDLARKSLDSNLGRQRFTCQVTTWFFWSFLIEIKFGKFGQYKYVYTSKPWYP